MHNLRLRYENLASINLPASLIRCQKYPLTLGNRRERCAIIHLKTVPQDSTGKIKAKHFIIQSKSYRGFFLGIAHILEHCTLCKYCPPLFFFPFKSKFL